MRLAPVSLALACAIASGKEITLFYMKTCTVGTSPDGETGWYRASPDEVKPHIRRHS